MSILTQHRQQQIAAGRTKHLSHVLMQADVGLKRKDFDPSSAADRLQYAYFLETGKWQDGKAFNVELPYANVPTTVQAKLVRHFLQRELAKVSGETVRLVSLSKEQDVPGWAEVDKRKAA